MGVGHRRFGSIPILENISQNRMSAELPLSIRIHHVVKLKMSMITSRELSCRWCTPSLYALPNVMVVVSEHLRCLFLDFFVVNTSSYQLVRHGPSTQKCGATPNVTLRYGSHFSQWAVVVGWGMAAWTSCSCVLASSLLGDFTPTCPCTPICTLSHSSVLDVGHSNSSILLFQGITILGSMLVRLVICVKMAISSILLASLL